MTLLAEKRACHERLVSSQEANVNHNKQEFIAFRGTWFYQKNDSQEIFQCKTAGRPQ